VTATTLVLERRCVVRVVGGRVTLATECPRCGELKAVVNVPAAHPRPASVAASSTTARLAAVGR